MSITFGHGITLGHGITASTSGGGGASIGSTTSTVTPSVTGSVSTGTTNGSPFGTSVNSYQFATQPASAPYNTISFSGANVGFNVGTGDFTVEWFQYQTVAASFARIFWYGASPSLGISLEGSMYFWPSVTSLGSPGSNLNAWVHFAVVRISNKLYAYRNGTLISTAGGVTNNTNISDNSSTFYIGSKANGGLQSEQFSGSITSFRFCNVGVYTGAFTTPTSPLGQTQSANPYGGSNTSAITSGQCKLLLNP